MLTKLGPFRIRSRIAKGGMGETFRAERVLASNVLQQVCLKVLTGEDVDDPKLIEGFVREASLVAQLRHSNVVALYELGETMGTWWMALELVEGMDLRALTSERRASGQRLPLEVVVYIAIELAKALAHAHAARLEGTDAVGIIHRDVSPSNILLSQDGAVKLADFGIAKVKQEHGTRTGKIAGKVFYMSPEQALGEHLDGRSDLFPLGIVLFELLAGVRPFDHQSETTTRLNSLHDKKHDLRALAPEVPEALVAIVNHLIASKRDERTPSADALLDALSAFPVPANVVRTLGQIVRDASSHIASAPDELTEQDIAVPPSAPRTMSELGDGDSARYVSFLGKHLRSSEDRLEQTVDTLVYGMFLHAMRTGQAPPLDVELSAWLGEPPEHFVASRGRLREAGWLRNVAKEERLLLTELNAASSRPGECVWCGKFASTPRTDAPAGLRCGHCLGLVVARVD